MKPSVTKVTVVQSKVLQYFVVLKYITQALCTRASKLEERRRKQVKLGVIDDIIIIKPLEQCR